MRQRFELDPQIVFWGRIVDTSRDDWHGGENGIRRMARNSPSTVELAGIARSTIGLSQKNEPEMTGSGQLGVLVCRGINVQDGDGGQTPRGIFTPKAWIWAG